MLIADDQPLIIAGFEAALAKYNISLCGDAASPEMTIALYEQLNPDVLVLDVQFGRGKSGLDVATEILDEDPEARIVFLSQSEHDQLVKEAYHVGALAFVTKNASPSDLATAIHRVHHGEQYFMPDIAARLASLSVRRDKSPQTLLDARELAIFVLVARGFTIAEMVDELALSQKTISNSIASIKQKLGDLRQAEITLLAVRHELINA